MADDNEILDLILDMEQDYVTDDAPIAELTFEDLINAENDDTYMDIEKLYHVPCDNKVCVIFDLMF